MTQRLWVEGVFPSTNQALDLRGQDALYLKASHGRRLEGGFAATAAGVRNMVKLLGRRLRPVPPGELAIIGVYLVNHCRYDPDGWTLAGKWLVDGLADAGVICSDRRNVYTVGGRCFTTPEEGRAFLWARDDMHANTGRRPGALVEIATGKP